MGKQLGKVIRWKGRLDRDRLQASEWLGGMIEHRAVRQTAEDGLCKIKAGHQLSPLVNLTTGIPLL
jgi:hypothetical protein